MSLPKEISPLRNFIVESKGIGQYYYLKLKSLPIDSIFLATRQLKESRFNLSLIFARLISLEKELDEEFGNLVRLEIKTSFFGKKNFSFSATSEKFKGLSEKMNFSQEILRKAISLDVRSLEINYIFNSKTGPGLYGAPELKLVSPTVTIELECLANPYLNFKSRFEESISLIGLIERELVDYLSK